MAFWRKPTVNKKQLNSMSKFSRDGYRKFVEMARSTNSNALKQLYYNMARSIARTGIYFHATPHIRAGFQRKGNVLVPVAVEGENVKQYMMVTSGKEKKLLKKNFINVSAKRVFNGNKMSVRGIFDLAHEWGHFEKNPVYIQDFAKKRGLSLGVAEELLADLMAAKLARRLGFSQNQILKEFKGRSIVYGKYPFMRDIARTARTRGVMPKAPKGKPPLSKIKRMPALGRKKPLWQTLRRTRA